jgi:hypothetical protein
VQLGTSITRETLQCNYALMNRIGRCRNKRRILKSLNGGQGRNRTADASLFRAALYRLSYLAISGGLHTFIFGGRTEDFVRTERFLIITTSLNSLKPGPNSSVNRAVLCRQFCGE